jgi:predicted SAM-dependent methyltransferase
MAVAANQILYSLRRPLGDRLRKARRLPRLLRDLLRPLKWGRTLLYHSGCYRLSRRQFKGVHLGSGGLRIDGFLNFDADIFIDCDVIARSEKIKLADNSVEIIYASHLLEHIARADIQRVMAEWQRVIKPGGRLVVCVPDLEILARVYLDNLGALDSEEGRYRAELACGIMYGGQVDKYDFHFYGYSFATISRMLKGVGFSKVERFDRKQLDFAPFYDGGYAMIREIPVSLNVQAFK